jgi:hypothetical protein
MTTPFENEAGRGWLWATLRVTLGFAGWRLAEWGAFSGATRISANQLIR